MSICAILAGGLISPTVMFGQASTSSGAIQGTITDQNGAVVPGATVSVKNSGTDQVKTFVTDSSGFYSAGSLVPGRYAITVAAPGFSSLSTTVTVQIGTSTNGDEKLTVGSATQEVVVTGQELQVNTTQSTVEGVLTAQQIDSLPISGRNFLDLAQLEPGVQLQSGETFDPTKAGYSSISINGVNGRTARILLDGQDISDETVGTTTLNVSQGSIEEFQISRSSLDISNELTSSGSVTVSTRTGTNTVHGQAFGLFRDQRAGAAAAPGGADYPFQRDQFGGRLGGPILKDKLFLFGSIERVKQDSFNSVQVGPPFQALSGGYTSPFRDNYMVGRMDYNAPKGVHLFFRAGYENNLDDSTFGYGYSRYGNKDNTPAFASGADFVTGNFTHSLRWSYLKFHNLIADESASGVPNLAPGVELFNQSLITGPNLLAPQQTYQSDKQLRYDGGLTYKSHLFNFGISVNRILGGGFASFFGFAPELSANFAGGPVGGSGLATDPTAYSTAYIVMGNGEGFNTEKSEFGYPAGGQGDWRLGLYFGDTWRVNPRLTVNYGIRYSRDTGRSDSDLGSIPCTDAVAVFGALAPCTSGNLFDALTPGLGSRVRQPNADFGPKVGFAYDLKGDGKTVIRGGLGQYFENNIFNNVLFDRPGRLKTGLFFSDSFLPAGTSTVTLPGGSSISTINGVAISSLWGEPISQSAPYFAALEAAYQAATKSAGAAANGSYVGNSLASGGNANGDSLYTPNFQVGRSLQMNIGVQRQVWKGGIVTADYIRNVGTHFMQSIDMNHVGDAKYIEANAAANAISGTLAACGVATIDQAIAACPGLHTSTTGQVSGATISDFASFGLDSGNAYLDSNPAAAFGLTPDTGAAFAGTNPLFGAMHFNLPLGRSVYNGLQTNLRQSSRVPIPGLKASNFEVSFSLGRFISSGGTDQNFTPGSYDYNNPLGFSGPGGIDRKYQLSYGGTFEWLGGVTTSLIGHYYSALPSNLTLDTLGNTVGEIFMSDVTGDGTTGDILPGYKAGAFMRSVKPKDLAAVITGYNASSAGKLTPAGQALVSGGYFTSQELTSLGAVTRSIAGPPTGNAGNGNLRTFDLTLGRPTKIKKLGESTSIEPTISFFNLFNLSNFGTVGGNLANYQQPLTANGTDTSLSSRGALRLGNGSGVFSQGASRIIEYGLKVNF